MGVSISFKKENRLNFSSYLKTSSNIDSETKQISEELIDDFKLEVGEQLSGKIQRLYLEPTISTSTDFENLFKNLCNENMSIDLCPCLEGQFSNESDTCEGTRL